MGKSDMGPWSGLIEFDERARPCEPGCRWSPAADVLETEDAFTIVVELPGLTLDDVSLELRGKTLRIHGTGPDVTVGGARHHVVERPKGRFSRTFTLGFPMAESDVAATLGHGLLTITVTKPASRRRTIPVR